MKVKVGGRSSRAGGRDAKTKTKREGRVSFKKRFCRFCADKVKAIDYKDTKKLEYFITERGKMTSTRVSGNCAKHQRMLSEAIKQARFVSLIPYVR